MKITYLFGLFLIISSFQSYAGITMVSDLDETIKITNSGSIWGATVSSFKKSKVFTGIPEFFKGSRSYVDKMYVLSASPNILRRKISKALKTNDIQYDGIILKPWSKFEDRLKFKVRVIRELMEKSNDDFILLGDDVGDDPEVYAEIMRVFPERVLEAYIRVVKKRKIPSSVITFWTSHEIAVRENTAGRMTFDAVDKVIRTMSDETDLELIFPKFTDCPRTAVIWAWLLDTPFASDVFDLNNNFVSYCTM